MGDRARLVAGSAWAIGGNVVNGLLSLAVLAVLARHLSPGDFGTVAFVVVILDLVAGILLSGFGDALARQTRWDERLATGIFWASAALGLMLTAFAVAAAAIVEHVGAPAAALVLLALAPVLLIEGVTGPSEARMRCDLRFRALAARQIVGTVGGGVLALAALYAGLGLWALVVQRLATQMVQSILVWAWAGWRPLGGPSLAGAAPALPFIFHLTGANALGQINLRIIDLIVGVVAGPAALATYQVAARGVAVLVQAIILPAQRVALIAFARTGDAEAIGVAYMRITRSVALASFPAFLGIAAIAPDFVATLFGPQWRAAGPVLTWLALAVGPQTLGYFATPALSAAGFAPALFRYSVVMTTATSAVTIAAAPFGIVAVAAANTLRAHLLVPVMLAMLRRTIRVAPLAVLRGMAVPAACAAAMAASVIALLSLLPADAAPAARLIAAAGIGMASYALLLGVLARPSLQLAWREVGAAG